VGEIDGEPLDRSDRVPLAAQPLPSPAADGQRRRR
jgi:hypothetical protein